VDKNLNMDPNPLPLPGSSPDEMFPVLTSEQQARVRAQGHVRTVPAGETVVEPNEQAAKL